ncbi:penicillin-binding protein activator [Rhodoblastus acidophilus]|uniref:Penicillin-binding protein activator n=1 Tax=Candidatus Rhodoblastus alkanivorans TaxID=2954117 RepID=A0ABS9Z1J9_9HYPH|nr:penicillin-binding protein activator [Candidatus Rhodoblastus alkanivorans]MCI4678150.1 penicillin-binding protein activator [Candidatus Rhodoblastus alkanivorans]MCI4681200.1 penicillin-binding protein activator [Candidatus Rhodoblastus alkanivorans]MDI4642243.1 penicillin-binding protein activator [Rhodoblastus acidophilus]
MTNDHCAVARRSFLRAALLGGAAALSACSVTGLNHPEQPGAPTPAPGPTPNAATFGNGPVKVALILPLTQGSGPSAVGVSMRNAAELAIQESGANDITVLVKDDHSTPDGASAAAQAALGEGAELILGPLFAADVRAAAAVARPAGKPIIAFSTDLSIASHGVYLLSFLVEGYVNRIIDYAADQGRKSVAALAPENEYANVAIGALQQAAARRGMRVALIERYKPGGVSAAAAHIAALGDQIDCLFIPDQAGAMPDVGRALTANAIDPRKVQILGTGLWNDARVLSLPALQGAWFATPENAGFVAFAQRYRAKFGSDPTRVATLAYDSVSLAAALARSQGARRFSDDVLTNPTGFNGADGVFRFKPDGSNERGLAVVQINNGTIKVISPAPTSL